MKEIKAIIQPFRLSEVVDALRDIRGLPGITVSEVRGFGKAVDDGIDYAAKTKLEVVVPDDLVEEVLRTICLYGKTGHPGDGKIFVSAIDEVVKVRTGERGQAAV